MFPPSPHQLGKVAIVYDPNDPRSVRNIIKFLYFGDNQLKENDATFNEKNT